MLLKRNEIAVPYVNACKLHFQQLKTVDLLKWKSFSQKNAMHFEGSLWI